MDQFEDTVVNPNISLNNFETGSRKPVKEQAEPKPAGTANSPKTQAKKATKTTYIAALLASLLIYQITAVI